MATTDEETTALATIEPEAVLDIDRQSIRGRACPQCGGKIIPSNTAVFAGQGETSTPFVSWQCERCGYLEVFEMDPAVKSAHGKPATGARATTVAKAAPGGNGNNHDSGSASGVSDLPPDVRGILEIFRNREGKDPG